MSVTNQQMLDAVDAAIYAILTGGAVQSYNVRGSNVNMQKYSLAELRDMKRNLEKKVAAENGKNRNFVKFTS